MTAVLKLSETARGVLMSSMSDAGCAMTLGRGVAWVARMRAELAAQAGAPRPTPPRPHAPRPTPHAPRPTPHAPRPTPGRCLMLTVITTEKMRAENDMLCLPPPSAAVIARMAAMPCPTWARMAPACAGVTMGDGS